MSYPIVVCVPNFSEARREEVVQAICAAAQSVPGVVLLDRHSDSDHNRTVLTLAGHPEAALEAAFRAIREAAKWIDLNQHQGVHPRLGATDVVPFVPFSGVTLEECVALARRLGERVGRELDIPVYLYEAAATRPERVRLEDIRRGQYEGLKSEIETNPARQPDYGPARLGPAGATVIGARMPLIAYNIYLDTGDVQVARVIARKIRASAGGLPAVKALGLLVGGRAQVSINLTDYRQTSLLTVVETVRREAETLGTHIHHAELVGLIPREAITDVAARALHLEGFTSEKILEERLNQAFLEERGAFLDALAAPSAAPAGGAAAAYAGAMAAALVAMAAGLTVGRSGYETISAQMEEIRCQAQRLRRELAARTDEEAAVYEQVLAAFRLPQDTEEQRAARAVSIEKAALAAIRIPLAIAQQAAHVLALAERCVALGHLNILGDAIAAAVLARAALAAAACAVRLNVQSLPAGEEGEKALAVLEAAETRAKQVEADLHQAVQERCRFALG